jgi:hypothetical protein
MSSQSINKNDKTNKTDLMDNELDNEPNKNLGGFPPIIYLGRKNKKIREFSQLNNNDENIKNIDKLNILNIKNILGV